MPLHQCVDTSSWRRQHHRPGAVPTGLESSHLQSPTSPWDKEGGRVSTGSIFDSIRDARSMERVSCEIQPPPALEQIATSQCDVCCRSLRLIWRHWRLPRRWKASASLTFAAPAFVGPHSLRPLTLWLLPWRRKWALAFPRRLAATRRPAHACQPSS